MLGLDKVENPRRRQVLQTRHHPITDHAPTQQQGYDTTPDELVPPDPVARSVVLIDGDLTPGDHEIVVGDDVPLEGSSRDQDRREPRVSA
jgi:hypothetical protein